MKVTTKGQVTIPARIRDYLGIVPHCDVDFLIREEQVVLTKPTPVSKGGGASLPACGVVDTNII